jgi:hypothetical protein
MTDNVENMEQTRLLRELSKKLERLTPEQRERFTDWLIERILEPVTYREGGTDHAEGQAKYAGEHTGETPGDLGVDAGREE